MNSVTDDDRRSALLKLKGRDRIGVTGEAAGVALGAGAGMSASGALAGAMGASTLLGSSTLGSVLGGVFVTATPVGWVIGGAVAAGALGYGISRLVRSGAEADVTRERLRHSIETDLKRKSAGSPQTAEQIEAGITELVRLLEKAAMHNRITPELGDRVLSLVRQKKLPVALAVRRVRAVIMNSHRVTT